MSRRPFISDNGKEIEMVVEDQINKKAFKRKLARYAVWEYGKQGKDKHEVSETSNDLEYLKKKYNVADSDIYPVPNMTEGNMKIKAFKSEKELVTFLTETLIPDLKRSGDDETAKDFTDLVVFLSGEKTSGDWKSPTEFIDYLENTYIPDLKESGKDATAEDLEDGVRFLKKKIASSIVALQVWLEHPKSKQTAEVFDDGKYIEFEKEGLAIKHAKEENKEAALKKLKDAGYVESNLKNVIKSFLKTGLTEAKIKEIVGIKAEADRFDCQNIGTGISSIYMSVGSRFGEKGMSVALNQYSGSAVYYIKQVPQDLIDAEKAVLTLETEYEKVKKEDADESRREPLRLAYVKLKEIEDKYNNEVREKLFAALKKYDDEVLAIMTSLGYAKKA